MEKSKKVELDINGFARLENIPSGECIVEFLDYPNAEIMGN
jgi:hypothetical protein